LLGVGGTITETSGREKHSLELVQLDRLVSAAMGGVEISMSRCSLTLFLSLLGLALWADDKRWAHWSFQPIREPAAGSTIDSRRGASPPAVDADALLRRGSFALLGLPPTPVEQAAWREQASKPGAWEAQVDAWLARPEFGERWAQHWLDVARFAESKGHEYDFWIHGAWRYRDYLIRAFNADLPWPQFIREHVMGDMLSPPRRASDGSDESKLATMFWHLGESATSPTDLRNDEADRVSNQIDTFGKAFLGMTMGCARCHDHKFDPITQRDFTALYGVIASTPLDRAWVEPQTMRDIATQLKAARDRIAASPIKAQPWPKLEFKDVAQQWDAQSTLIAEWSAAGWMEQVQPSNATLGLAPGWWSGTLSKKLPARVRSPIFTITEDYVDMLVSGQDASIVIAPQNLQVIFDPIYPHLRREIKTEAGEWRWERFKVGRWKGYRVTVEAFTGKTEQPLETRASDQQQFGLRAVLHHSGELPAVPKMAKPASSVEWAKQREPIEAKLALPEHYLAVAEPAAGGQDVPLFVRGDAKKPTAEAVPRASWSPPGPAAVSITGSGRAALTAQLTDPKHPLVARVLVNRVWHHLFGKGIVLTCDDLGRLGEAPVEPALLDDLAWRFQHQHRGSVKALIREIMLSAAWKAVRPEPRRLEAEALRDALLAVSGRLDRSLHGPSVPARPRGYFFTNVIDVKEEGGVDGAGRRSIYLRNRRNTPDAFLAIFDKPPPMESFGRRVVSQVPAQALTLLNDPLVHLAAKHWGDAAARSDQTRDALITQLHEHALTRTLTAEDRIAADELLGTAKPDAAAWARLAHAYFNLKEFLYVP
jgi:hypothetical protein